MLSGPPREHPAVQLDPFDVIATFGERGPIAGQLSRYEDRQCQRDMAAHITDGYNDGGVQLLEAGTGVGKSFGGHLQGILAWCETHREFTLAITKCPEYLTTSTLYRD